MHAPRRAIGADLRKVERSVLYISDTSAPRLPAAGGIHVRTPSVEVDQVFTP